MKTFLNFNQSIDATSGNLLYQALLAGNEQTVSNILSGDSKPEFSTIHDGAGATHVIFQLALWSPSIMKMLCNAYPNDIRISPLLEQAMEQRYEETAKYLIERLLESSEHAYKLRGLSETYAHETFKYLVKSNKLTPNQIRNIYEYHLGENHTKIVLDILEHHFEHLEHVNLQNGLVTAVVKQNISLLEVILKLEKNKFTEREMWNLISRALDPMSVGIMWANGHLNIKMLRVLMRNVSLNGIPLSQQLTAEFFENDQKLLDFVKLYLSTGTLAAIEPVARRSEDWRSASQRRAVSLQTYQVRKFNPCVTKSDFSSEATPSTKLEMQAVVFEVLTKELSQLSLAEAQAEVQETCSNIIRWSQSAAASSSSACGDDTPDPNSRKGKLRSTRPNKAD